MIKNDRIDKGREFDWGLTSAEYAKYRDIYPDSLYKRLYELGVANDNTSWLDLGTGTGILPKNLYNDKAEITAVDISNEQIEFAKKIARQNKMKINYFASPAEKTELEDASFDCITAAQCFWYFEHDSIKAEIKRLLKPGGKFIKIYMTYTLDDEIAAKSHEMVRKANKDWTPGASGSKDMYDDLFYGRVTETFYCDIPFTRESWHGRMCACRGTLASLNKSEFNKWENNHRKFLSTCAEAFTIKHKLYISYFTL